MFTTFTDDQVRAFKEAIAAAHWQMDLWTFARVMGNDASHAYTQDKFRELSELNKAIGKFDAETLAKILNWWESNT